MPSIHMVLPPLTLKTKFAIVIGALTLAVAMLITSFLTPVLMRRADRLALYIDASLPRPLQTVASLYGTWVETIRSRRSGSPWAPFRYAIGVLLLEAAMLAAIAISTSIQMPRFQQWVGSWFRLDEDASRLGVIAVAIGLAVPFTVALARTARWIGNILSERAITI